MHAVVLDRIGGPEVLEYRARRRSQTPEPDEVLVRVRAAGVCGRDLIDRRGGFPAMKLPAILGHEVAGEVVAVGGAVTRFGVGDRVANLHRPYCGDCDRCQEGESPDCTESWQSFGQTVAGGYAETVRAHHRSLVPIPDAVSFVDAAPLGCTAAVALRALRHEGRLTLGETVLVTGATGGVGMEAIQIAKHLGARVIALTSSPDTKTMTRCSKPARTTSCRAPMVDSTARCARYRVAAWTSRSNSPEARRSPGLFGAFAHVVASSSSATSRRRRSR